MNKRYHIIFYLAIVLTSSIRSQTITICNGKKYQPDPVFGLTVWHDGATERSTGWGKATPSEVAEYKKCQSQQQGVPQSTKDKDQYCALLMQKCKNEIFNICPTAGPWYNYWLQAFQIEANGGSGSDIINQLGNPPQDPVCIEQVKSCSCLNPPGSANGQISQSQLTVLAMDNAGSNVNNALQVSSQKQTAKMASENQKTVNDFNNTPVYSQTSKPKLKASDIDKDYDDDDQTTQTSKTDEQKKKEFINQVTSKQEEMDDAKKNYEDEVAEKISHLSKREKECTTPGDGIPDKTTSAGEVCEISLDKKAKWSAWYTFGTQANVEVRFSPKVNCPSIQARDLIATNFVDMGMNVVNAGANSFFDYGYYQFRNMGNSIISGTIQFESTPEKAGEETHTNTEPFYLEPSETGKIEEGNWYIGCKVLNVQLVECCKYPEYH